MDEFYNKHYITIDDRRRIVFGWSNGPLPDKSTDDAILLNDKGGYQFRLLFPDGSLSEENPALFEFEHMIPLYAYENSAVRTRTQDEIDEDIAAIPDPEPVPTLDERVTEVETDVNDISAAMDALLTGEGMI